MTDSSPAAAAHHEHNKETLVAAAAAVSPPPPALNPLLARGKLKKPAKGGSAGKGKGKAKIVKDVYKAKQDELEVVSAGGVGGGEEGEVLDLADQLLEQLGGQLEDDAGNAAPPPAPSKSEPPSRGTPLSPSSTLTTNSQGSGHSAREMFQGFKEDLRDAFLPSRQSPNGNGERKMGRQEARKLRKANAFEQQRREAAAEVAADNDRSVEMEKEAISAQCRKLKVMIKEIEPDGHCMYSAVADQVNFLKLAPSRENYQSIRQNAAAYMRTHPDEFLPFLPSELEPDNMMSPEEFAKYCDTVERTAEWGGEPEIRALSLHYQAPVIVVQAGTDMVEHGSDFPRERAMLISYHRKMYGLGEHYNSLRPTTHGAPHVLPPAPSMPHTFVNGRIFTADDTSDDLAQALVVGDDGKVEFVGDASTASSRYPAAPSTDLGGRCVIPGVIDAHSHLGMLGGSLLKPDLIHAQTLADIERILVDFRRRNPDAKRLLGRAWRFDSLVDEAGKIQPPSRHFLDRILPGVPVYLDSMDLHSVWCSTAAFEEMGIDGSIQDPKGGRFERDAAGSLTGLVLENAVVDHVWSFLAAQLTQQERHDALEAAFSSYLATGVTGAIDMAMSPPDLEALEESYHASGDELPIRVAAHWLISPEGTEADRLARVHEAIRHRDRLASCAPYLRVVGIKVITDGVIDACTAYIKDAYADGSRADPIWTFEELGPVPVEADKAGLQIACHAIGDAAVSVALDALEHTFAVNGPRHDRRHRLEHMELISPEDVHRLARLQITASLQPVHADPVIAPNWHAQLNYDERTKRAFVWDEFRNAGCRIALGTDAPTAPHYSLPNMYVATTRRSALEPDMPWPPPIKQLAKYGHTVFSLRDALIGATRGAAHSCHSDAEVGVLAPGRSADFAVLSIDPFKDGVDCLAKAQDAVVETWVAGKKVFSRA
ncbi:amidohydrolase family protein [Rhodotorula toruloides]